MMATTPPKLVGLDFGTTTSSALVADARIRRNVVTGRMEAAVVRETFRSPLVFTPLAGDGIDLAATLTLVDEWLARGGVEPGVTPLLGGGAILTGLTARADNAAGLVAALRRRLGPALVATADDPCLESWLAFQGSCAALSRRHPRRRFVHLDIGGGTTNLALGSDGNVLATGCLFVGARHVRFRPGTRRIESLSPHAGGLFGALGIVAGPGDDLPPGDLERLLDWYLALIHRAVFGVALPSDPSTLGHVQVPFLPVDIGGDADPVITFSGGVGELVYAAAGAAAPTGITPYGDLGADLATRLLDDPALSPCLRAFTPDGAGRATVVGLLRHATRISGASIHLPASGLLPLADLPIVGTLRLGSPDPVMRQVLDLARRSAVGAAVRVEGIAPTVDAVRPFAERLAGVLETVPWPGDRPLVLLLDTDCGKALGQCATGWGRLPLPLVVVDQLDIPAARFATLGAPQDGVVPVSFHGLDE